MYLLIYMCNVFSLPGEIIKALSDVLLGFKGKTILLFPMICFIGEMIMK